MKLHFQFFDTEDQARAFCDGQNRRYPWRKRRASFTPWSSSDGTQHKFVALYYC